MEMARDIWSNGWRKLVEWDVDSRVYLYKGYRILPLSFKEQVEMPIHLQNEYYWGEIDHIEKVFVSRENQKNIDVSEAQAELQNAMNMFWESVGL